MRPPSPVMTGSPPSDADKRQQPSYAVELTDPAATTRAPHSAAPVRSRTSRHCARVHQTGNCLEPEGPASKAAPCTSAISPPPSHDSFPASASSREQEWVDWYNCETFRDYAARLIPSTLRTPSELRLPGP